MSAIKKVLADLDFQASQKLLRPVLDSANTPAVEGQIGYDPSAHKVRFFNGSSVVNLISGDITNADISGSAAIAYGKLDLAGSIHSADISALGIDYAKLNLTGSIVNADIDSAAAIAYSKLNLASSIVNADISSSAAIVDSKLAQITTASKVSGAAITLTTTWVNTGAAVDATISGGTATTGITFGTAPATVVTYFPPESTYITNTWGTPTVASTVSAPTY